MSKSPKNNIFNNQAGYRNSYRNDRSNKGNLFKIPQSNKKDFKTSDKVGFTKQEEDHEHPQGFLIRKRSLRRNMYMTMAFFLNTLSSAQAREREDNQSSANIPTFNPQVKQNLLARDNPDELAVKKEIFNSSLATIPTFNPQVKQNLLAQDGLSKTVDMTKAKSATKKSLKDFNDEDLAKLTPSLLASIKTKKDPTLFKKILSNVDDSASFSRLIALFGNEESHSFLDHPLYAGSEKFIEIIDQRITEIAIKEALNKPTDAEAIYKELWQQALRQKGLSRYNIQRYPLYMTEGKPKNIEKILTIAKKFGDDFVVELLNQENEVSKNTLLLMETRNQNHDSLVAILNSLKDNKEALLKVLTKTNAYNGDSLVQAIFENDTQNFETMLSYVDDSTSFSKLIGLSGNEKSHSFLVYAVNADSEEFIDIIDRRITAIANKEANAVKPMEDIYKELWQQALSQKGLSRSNVQQYPLHAAEDRPQNIKKILTIAEKFGDDKDSSLTMASYFKKNDIIEAALNSLQDNKEELLKVLTKTDIGKDNFLTHAIDKKQSVAFDTMLSYVNDSTSFSSLIASSGNEKSHSFLVYALNADSEEFIDIIDRRITAIANKEASTVKSKEDIYKELWQQALRQKGISRYNSNQFYPFFATIDRLKNFKKILAIAEKFGDDFVVEILNQENGENKDSLLIKASFLKDHDIIKATLDSLKDNKDALLKVLTKTNIFKNNSLIYAIDENQFAAFTTMLSYFDDSASFSKLIASSGNEESNSFLVYALNADSEEFIDIIDQRITAIANKEASTVKSKEDIYKELWQQALRQKGALRDNEQQYPLYITRGKLQNLKKILTIAKKFGDDFVVELLNQENLKNNDSLLIIEIFLKNHDVIKATLDSLKDNKDALLKVLTKTNIFKNNSLIYAIDENQFAAFTTMLSYVNDSTSFSSLIASSGNEESNSFLVYALNADSEEFIDIIDQRITAIANKEASTVKSKEDIYKELWQQALRQKGISRYNSNQFYPFFATIDRLKNFKKILAIAEKFGDDFVVEILNQENGENKDSLLIKASFLKDHDIIKATLDSLKDNKDALLKVLTKTNIFKNNSLIYAIDENQFAAFTTMLSYFDDSASFSKLIASSGNEESNSFLVYALNADSEEFIDIIDQRITAIAKKEAPDKPTEAEAIYKELWQQALRQKGISRYNSNQFYPLYATLDALQNFKRVLTIAKKFGDDFVVEILNQENGENKDSLLIKASSLENHDVIKATLDSLKDNKDALLKVLTKTNIFKNNSLIYAALKDNIQNFVTMLSYLDNKGLKECLQNKSFLSTVVLKDNTQNFATMLSYLDDNGLKELLQNKYFLSFIFDNGRYDVLDIFLDRLILAKKSGAILTEDIQKTLIFQHQEIPHLKEIHWLSGISTLLLAGNENIVKKLLELNDNLSFEEFPKRHSDENIHMVRYYVEQIQKNEGGLEHIKVEHLVFEDSVDESQKVKQTPTKPEDFALVDEHKTFAGFRVVDSKSGVTRNVISLRLKPFEKMKNLKIIKKLLRDDAVDKIIINLSLEVDSSGEHRTTLCLTKDQNQWRVVYHNPNGYDDKAFQEKFMGKIPKIFSKLEIEVKKPYSPTEVIVPNDAFGSCGIIGSIVAAVWVLGWDCEDKIRSDCRKIIESDQYETERNFKKGKCITNIFTKWNHEIHQKLTEKLQRIKQEIAGQKPVELTSKQTEDFYIIRGHNGIVSQVYDKPSNKISVIKEEFGAAKIASNQLEKKEI